MSNSLVGKHAAILDECYKLIERKDLSYDLQLVWDMAGRDVAIALVKHLASTRIYTSRIERMPGCMEKFIPKLLENMSVIEVAQLMNITSALVKRYK